VPSVARNGASPTEPDVVLARDKFALRSSTAFISAGDNGPLTASNVLELGRVDILMMPIDARERYQVRARVAQHQDGRGEGAVLAAEYLANPGHI
jgi:hypothetical protein